MKKFNPAKAFELALKLKQEGKQDSESYKQIMSKLRTYFNF
ncbi:hypothetical protein [Natroniella acetigena]|nr:hypothetical protein [Natroniella acetigena]